MNVFHIVTRGPYLLIVKTLQQAKETAYVKSVECFKAGLANFNQQESHMILQGLARGPHVCLHILSPEEKYSNSKKKYFVSSVKQCFSASVRPLPGKVFFRKTRARSQQIYSSAPFQFFLSSYIKLTHVFIINYGVLIKSISTLMCTVWHVNKYKITFKLFINSRRNSRGPV